MNLHDKIQIIRASIEATDDDDVLAAYLYKAGQLILNVLYPTEPDRADMEIPAMYVAKQIEIAEYLLNKRGAEGEIQHIENGIHRNYGSSYVPEAMLRDITPFCGVVK